MNTIDELRSGALKGASRISLACGLEEVPRDIFSLADTLEVLDLSNNALSTLPDDLHRLRKLRIVFASHNRFTQLPAVLGQCTQLEMIGFRANQISEVPAASLPERLRWLVLTDNRLRELPAALGRCSQLQKLMLAGNQLSTLPPEMAACLRLELLRIAANAFEVLPEWLLHLPRLAWLAFAGNPLSRQPDATIDSAIDTAHARARHIHWHELTLHDKLGEGASGIIYKGDWQRDPSGASRPVAIKLFKGAMTSDGLPQSEMAACTHAGAHPSLITVHGEIAGHPHHARGLVMDLIAPRFRNLGDPPSLASCTRDVYETGFTMSLQATLRLALGIASAARQLHARGILHGDLYAHNILCTDTGEALLGDFGAASFFDAGDRRLALALQAIEVRAFGNLLEELLAICSGTAPDADGEARGRARAVRDALTALQAQCTASPTHARPSFAQLEHSLATL